SYIRLIDFGNADEKEIKVLEAIENPKCGYYYETSQDNFELIPGSPIAYWASDNIYRSFKNKSIGDIFPVKKGSDTGNNNRYLRRWYEVDNTYIGLGLISGEETTLFNKKW